MKKIITLVVLASAVALSGCSTGNSFSQKTRFDADNGTIHIGKNERNDNKSNQKNTRDGHESARSHSKRDK